MEEVEGFKSLGVWFERKLHDNVHLKRVANKARVGWKDDMDDREWTGGR